MLGNELFWTSHIREVFIEETRKLSEVLKDRILKAFDNIDQEAEKLTEEEYERLLQTPVGEDGGPGIDVLAERAEEKGIDFYLTMRDLRQGLINMFAVAVYGLFTQHLMTLHRKQLLEIHEENHQELFTMDEVNKRFRKSRIDIKKLAYAPDPTKNDATSSGKRICGLSWSTVADRPNTLPSYELRQFQLTKVHTPIKKFRSWGKIRELGWVANVVKHAEGWAADKLRKIRPDLFDSLRGTPFKSLNWPAPKATVFKPLFGQDVFVDLDEIDSYTNAIIGFWEELAIILERRARVR